MKKLLWAAAALSLATTANAQNSFNTPSTAGPVANPTSTISNFDIQSVGPVLNELGITWQPYSGNNGETVIAANANGELNFLLAPAACRLNENSDCVGLQMVAMFDGQVNPQSISAFNYRYAFSSAGLDDSGSAYLNRYEISDYGVPRGNLAISILVFIQQAKQLGTELATAGRTVALQGYASDLSATALNYNSLENVVGDQAHVQSAMDLHAIGFEDSAERVKHFIADKTAPRNKINNLSTD